MFRRKSATKILVDRRRVWQKPEAVDAFQGALGVEYVWVFTDFGCDGTTRSKYCTFSSITRVFEGLLPPVHRISTRTSMKIVLRIEKYWTQTLVDIKTFGRGDQSEASCSRSCRISGFAVLLQIFEKKVWPPSLCMTSHSRSSGLNLPERILSSKMDSGMFDWRNTTTPPWSQKNIYGNI